HALHHARGEVLDHDVARRAQTLGGLDRLGPLQIERDALLPLVVLVVVAAAVRAGLELGERRQEARHARAGRGLDADDLGAEVRRGEQVAHGRDRGERHAAALRRLVELLYRLLAAPLLQEDLERVEVRAPREAVGEELDRRPLRVAHDVDQTLPLVLLDAAEEDPPVAALHEAERLDRLGAQPRSDETAVGPELEGELEDGRQALLRRYLHVLAASRRQAGEEGAERADGRVQTGLEARLVAERLEGGEVGARGLAVQRRDAARAPGDDV